MTRRVLGIDPGLAATGWGVIESTCLRHTWVAHGTVATRSKVPLEKRLLHLYEELSSIFDTYKPVGMGIETLFFTKNVSSAILPVAQARGVAMLLAAQKGLNVGEYSPVVIKQSVVGTGGAAKNQVQEMIRLILGLPEIPRPDHAADALAAAVTFVHHIGL